MYMGIILNQQDNRSELQKRIAAELSEKAKKKHEAAKELPDGVEDSRYVEHTQQTGNWAWLWILLVGLLVVGAVLFVIVSGNQR